jgi:hypothetical protein
VNHLYFLDKPALGALALLIAVVVLYILRMPRDRVRLSSLSFLRQLQVDARRRRRRLRSFLSMLLQAFVLALLAFSAARPLLSSGRLMERRIVLVMDVSASMRTRDGEGGTTRFDEAKAKANETVHRMEHGDRMLIIAADSQARIVQQFEKDRQTLYRTIDEMRPGFQSTDLAKAFDLVREVIRPLAEAQVFLVSDGAAKVEADKYQDVLAKTQFLATGRARNNVGIVSFSSRRNMDSERDFSSLLVLQNTFDEPHKLAVKLSIGKETVDVKEVSLEAGKTHTEMYEKTLLVGGQFKAELTLLDPGVTDPFPLDDVAYEWIPKVERIKVLVVAPPDELGGYLDAAMSANIGVQGYRVTPDKYSARYDVGAMIFYNCIPAQFPDCDVIFVNTRGKNPAAEVAAGAVARPIMRTWDRTHPLMNYISLENLLLEEALNVKGAQWMEPVARTVQAPIVLAGRQGTQKMVFVAFDPKTSDFPFRLAFPVLVSNSLLWFSQEEGGTRETQVRPGDTYEIRIPRTLRERPGEITVVDPLQQKASLKVAGDSALYPQTQLCGVYTYSLGTREHGFAVNLSNAEESDIAQRPDFGKAFLAAATAEESAPAVERELWFVLNWFALALLCAEAYLYHQRILF